MIKMFNKMFCYFNNKICLNLTKRQFSSLKEMSLKFGNMNRTLKKALQFLNLCLKLRKQGYNIVVINKNNEVIKEIIF